MIKINKLNKYYFKGEQREIHVVNDISLELPDAGLVTFLGPSGSGKTTLINIIGGLDSQDSGSIEYNGRIFEKYDAMEIDKFRSHNIGYVFQNYLLSENISVYDNLKEALEIINIYDTNEQKKRIEYVLSRVGLKKYSKKKVKNLSGGQMQRVSIARALIKNASVIIADEPTGNIDSENTIAIMNILKKISQKTLVLLVTHEVSLARYYSDRIIQIKDGKVIADGAVINHGSLNMQTDRKLYLKDYTNEKINVDNVDLNLYVDQNSHKATLNIIVKNDTIYVKSKQNIINLNESSIEIVNQSSVIDENKEEDNFEYDTSWYQEDKTPKKCFNVLSLIKKGFQDVLFGSKRKLAFLIVFAILGSIIGICSIGIANYQNVDLSSVYQNDDVYVISNDKTRQNEFLPDYNLDILMEAYSLGHIEDLVPIKKLYYAQVSTKINFVKSTFTAVDVMIISYNDELELEYGTKPGYNDVVLGKKLANKILAELEIEEMNYQHLIGKMLQYKYRIVGVTKEESDIAYCNFAEVYNPNCHFTRIDDNAIGYSDSYRGIYTIIDGRDIQNNHEILVSCEFKEKYNLELNTYYNFDSVQYQIVGFYEFNDSLEYHNIITNDLNIVGYAYDFTNSQLINRIVSYQFGYLPFNRYVIVNGHNPANSNECVVNINSGLEIGSIYEEKIIVGQYTYAYQNDTSFNLVLDDLIILYPTEYIETASELTFIPNATAYEYFNQQGYEMMSLNEYQTIYLIDNHQKSNTVLPVIISALFLFVVCYTYFSNKSKIINDVTNISVYRSLGKSKKSIMYRHMAYIFAQTTLSSVLGYLLVYLIYYYFKYQFIEFTNFSLGFEPLLLIIGIIVLYLINILIGSLPLAGLLRKTPAEINSKYDI